MSVRFVLEKLVLAKDALQKGRPRCAATCTTELDPDAYECTCGAEKLSKPFSKAIHLLDEAIDELVRFDLR